MGSLMKETALRQRETIQNLPKKILIHFIIT